MTQPRSRHGTIYILVLVSSMIVTMIGLLGYKMIQAQAAVARANVERDEAAVLAESAVQWGIHFVSLKADWRSIAKSGVAVRSNNLGQGQIRITITDQDGNLNDGDSDSFTITGRGTIGTTKQFYEVTLAPGAAVAHPALNSSITVGDTLYVDRSIMILESGGTAIEHRKTNGDKYFGSMIITKVNPVDVPDPSLITTWSGMGTAITPAMHGGSVTLTSLSTTSAPFGLTPDPNGIYVVDAGGVDLIISEVTITGTLVVTNLGGSMVTFDRSNARFGTSGGPTLIVDGDLRYESDALTEIQQGVFYTNGNFEIAGNMVLVGKIMATGNVRVGALVGYVTLNDHPSVVAGPPVGFAVPSERCDVVPGSWQRIVN